MHALWFFMNYGLLWGGLFDLTVVSADGGRFSWTPSFGSVLTTRSRSNPWSRDFEDSRILADGPMTESSENTMASSLTRRVPTIDPATYYADWHRFLDGSTGQRCYAIPHNMSLCQKIGYHRMILPNFLQHEDLKEAVEQSQIWVSLAQTDCHPDLRKFLCALYAPICVDEFQERLIHPCADLCEDVRQSCLPKMLQFGFGWPDIVRCAQFPVSSSKMCVPLSEKARPQCSGCSEDPSFESVISSYCMADIAIRTRILHISVVNSTKQQPSYVIEVDRGVKPFKMNAPTGRWLKAVLVANCHCDLLEKYRKQDSRRMGKWIIMGKLTKDLTGFTVEHLSRIRQQSVGLKRAIRAMRQPDRNLCRLNLPRSPDEKPNDLNSRMETDLQFLENDLKSISTVSHQSMDSLQDELSQTSSSTYSNGWDHTSYNNKQRYPKKNKRRSLVRRSQKYSQYQPLESSKMARTIPQYSPTPLPRDRKPVQPGPMRVRHPEELKPPESEEDLFSPNNLSPWL